MFFVFNFFILFDLKKYPNIFKILKEYEIDIKLVKKIKNIIIIFDILKINKLS